MYQQRGVRKEGGRHSKSVDPGLGGGRAQGVQQREVGSGTGGVWLLHRGADQPRDCRGG